jgi:peroxiredoxin
MDVLFLLEDSTMKRSLISILAAFLAVGVAWHVFCSIAHAGAGQSESTRKAAAVQQQSSNVGSAQQQPESRQRRALPQEERQQLSEKLQARQEDGEQKEQLRELEEQISQLRAEHEELIGELKTIHEMAVKEKADEVAKRIEKLLSKERQAFQEKLRTLEQKHQRLQKALMGRKEQGQPTGRKAPEFSLESFDSKTVTLAEHKGKIVVLEWLNTECPFVQYHYEKAKTMIDLAKKYKGKKVVWLAVNSTSHTTPEANRQFAAKYKLLYPILDDRSGEVGLAYGAKTTPHIFVIDTNGNIAYDGAIDNSPLGAQKKGAVNYVDKALAELIAGKAVSTSKTEPYGCSVKYRR